MRQKNGLRPFKVFVMPPDVVMPMSCSLCEPESRADGALAAQELNQLIKMLPRRALPMQWQPRDSPISSNSTEYLARTTSAPAFQILEFMPATAPLGVVPTWQRPWGAQTLLRLILLRILRRLTRPPLLFQHVQPAPRRKSGRWPTTPTLLADAFWTRRRYW
jgi:hypothetical protein